MYGVRSLVSFYRWLTRITKEAVLVDGHRKN